MGCGCRVGWGPAVSGLADQVEKLGFYFECTRKPLEDFEPLKKAQSLFIIKVFLLLGGKWMLRGTKVSVGSQFVKCCTGPG